MSFALVTVLAVGTGVVVIVVAAAVVLLALVLSASMRGRRKGGDKTRRELRDAQERAERAERGRDVAEEQTGQRTGPDR